MEKAKVISKKKFLGILGMGFFTSLLGFGILRKTKDVDSGKIKMLTADGKIVEVDRSKLSMKKSASRATNTEVKKWMDSNR